MPLCIRIEGSQEPICERIQPSPRESWPSLARIWLSFCFFFFLNIRYWDRPSFKLKHWVCVAQLLFSVFTGGLCSCVVLSALCKWPSRCFALWLVFMLQEPKGLKEDQTTALFRTDDIEALCCRQLTNHLYQPSRGWVLKVEQVSKACSCLLFFFAVTIYITLNGREEDIYNKLKDHPSCLTTPECHHLRWLSVKGCCPVSAEEAVLFSCKSWPPKWNVSPWWSTQSITSPGRQFCPPTKAVDIRWRK